MDTIIDIEAARALNAARMQLDVIEGRPFYVRPTYINPVKDLLAGALTRICGDEDRAQQVYERLLDGVDVADALADSRRQWITDEFGDALTFSPDDRNGVAAEDGACRYEVWGNPGYGWTVRVSLLVDNGDTSKRAALYALPDRFTAELTARAFSLSASQDLSVGREGSLSTARDRALAAIEKHRCHGCARDPHGKGHIRKCPQATGNADRAGAMSGEAASQ